MRPIKNRVRFLTKFQIVSILLKIAPYHMQKFGRYQKIFVSLHQQSKEQPIVPKTGHL